MGNKYINREEDVVTNMYNFSENYSDLSEGQIAVNVKLYNMPFPNLEETKKILQKKGYEHEDIDNVLSEERAEMYIRDLIQSSIESFTEEPISGAKFISMTGRMGGYAIFEKEENFSLKKFEKEIKRRHQWLLGEKNVGAESFALNLIERNEILTPEEKENARKEQEIQDARKFHTEEIPTGNFTMNGNAYVVMWGENQPLEGELPETSIRMDEATFYSDSLTKEEILENLNDGQFGVKDIVGAFNLTIEEDIAVKKIFEDNGEVQEYIVREVRCEDAEILKYSDESTAMKQIAESGYTPQKETENREEQEKTQKRKKSTSKKTKIKP